MDIILYQLSGIRIERWTEWMKKRQYILILQEAEILEVCHKFNLTEKKIITKALEGHCADRVVGIKYYYNLSKYSNIGPMGKNLFT